MNNFKSQNSRHHSSSKLHNNKKRLTQDQVQLLEASFSANNKLDPHRKLQLSQQLHIPPRQIAIWYQNKRARWKNQSLELDYTSLHIQLESTLSQNRQLEKEAQHLRMELQKSQVAQMLSSSSSFGFKEVNVDVFQPQWQPQLAVSSPSSDCDEGGIGSEFHDYPHGMNTSRMNDGQVYDQALRVEELYAYLMGN